MAKASLLHEAPLEVLRVAPSLVLELLAIAKQPFGPLDSRDGGGPIEVVVADSHLAEPLPHFRAADFVAIVRTRSRAQCVVVEVQRTRVAAKKRVWPHYVTHLDLRLNMPVVLVVVTFDEGVARWARRSPPRGSVAFAPVVLGPAELRSSSGEDSPALVTLEALTQLAVLEHPRTEGEREAAQATVIGALRKLLDMAPFPARRTFVNLIHGTAGAVPTFCATLEKLLEDYGMGALDLIRKEGRAEGRAEGRSEGRAEGRSEGRSEGRAEGRSEGRAEGQAIALRVALLRVLETRGLKPSAERLADIEAADAEQILAWLDRAALASRIDDVFG